jgi:hypothetical protein
MRVSPRTFSALCALLISLLLPATAAATSTQSEIDAAIAKALSFAPAQQDPATGEPSEYEHTGFYSGEWLASGYAAAGLSAADLKSAGNPSLQDFLFGEAATFWDDPGPLAPEYAGRLTLVAHAAGIDTARITATQNLPAELVGSWKPSLGGFAEPNTFSTAWGLLALRTTPLPLWALAPAVSYLRTDQHPDGGWSFYRAAAGEPSDADITAAAVGALCTAGLPAYDPTVLDGLAYLHGLLVAGTGAVKHPVNGENIDTTTWTVNALEACGIDPQSNEWTSVDGKTPIDFILSLQLPAGGFPWLSGEPWFSASTGHALRALAGDGFVAAPPAREDSALPRVRPVPAVAAGTPTPHVLAVELAAGNVRLCNVTVPVGATLTALLDAAVTSSQPAGCIGSYSLDGGAVAEVDGISAPGAGESWLVRRDRGAAAVAASQPVGLGDVVSLWVGPTPPTPPAGSGLGTVGAAGQPGPVGPTGRRGPRGKPGRNAEISCRVHRRAGRSKVRCGVKHQGKQRPARASASAG